MRPTVESAVGLVGTLFMNGPRVSKIGTPKNAGMARAHACIGAQTAANPGKDMPTQLGLRRGRRVG